MLGIIPRHKAKVVDIGWRPPPKDWVKFNIDKASKDNEKKAACDGLCRGSNGEWKKGFVLNLGSYNAYVVGLRSAYYALTMTLQMQLHNIILGGV